MEEKPNQGELVDGKRNGLLGKFFYADGSMYSGEWKDDMRHGRGTFVDPRNGKYEGEWKEDKRNGNGTWTDKYGTYQGEWKDDMKEGFGIFQGTHRLYGTYEGLWKEDKKVKGRWTSGNKIYDGEWKDDKYDGFGVEFQILQFPKGAIVPLYEGQWKGGVKNGEGKDFLWGEGEPTVWHEGTWVNGIKQGKMKEYLPDGTLRYEGEYAMDERNGYGIEYLYGKPYHEGNWMNGQKHGRVKLYVEGELHFDAEFEHDHMKRGIRFLHGKKSYEGELRGFSEHGYGTSFLPDGSKSYEGEWENGQYHGVGITYQLKISGVFKHGEIDRDYQQKGRNQPKKVYFRRLPNGDKFKLVQPNKLKWVGIITESNKIITGSFQGLR